MPNQNRKSSQSNHFFACARYYADIIQDTSQGILAFIPNGLGLIYEDFFKKLPLLGNFFSHRLVEQLCKLLSGITLCQTLAADIAHFLFWPLGFLFGMLIGTLTFRQKIPNYQGQVGKWLLQVCGQTMGGAFIALVLLGGFVAVSNIPVSSLSIKVVLLFTTLGAIVGLLSKTFILFAIQTVQASNAATIRKNVQHAKELSTKLKKIAKQKARSHILMQAQDIIQQMNGGQSQQYLDAFFKEKYDAIALNIHKKLERHFDYLTDRACHGDLNALRRLQELMPTSTNKDDACSTLDKMLARIFNARTIAKIKDDVDTTYDRWQYAFLRSAQ